MVGLRARLRTVVRVGVVRPGLAALVVLAAPPVRLAQGEQAVAVVALAVVPPALSARMVASVMVFLGRGVLGATTRLGPGVALAV